MAILTSSDGVLSVTVVVNTNEDDGVYEIQITAVTPTNQEIAIELGGTRVWQGQARTDAGEGS